MTATSKDYPNTSTSITQNIEALAAEVELNPTDLVAKITLANALEQVGEIEKAVEFYQEVIALDENGIYGSVSRKALEAIEDSQPSPKSPRITYKGSYRRGIDNSQVSWEHQRHETTEGSSLFQRLRQRWENLNFRSKLALLLAGSIAIPVIIVTQILGEVAENRLSVSYQQGLKRELALLNDAIEKLQDNNEVDAAAIAKLVEISGINLNNSAEVLARHDALANFTNDSLEEMAGQSFHIITDAQGRTVTQFIEILDEDFSSYPTLPPKNSLITQPKYRMIFLPPGIPLSDIPIVKNVLRNGLPLRGTELFSAKSLQRLGLDKQANIGIREQKISGLPASKQPFPQGTYDIDEGKVGLVLVAVQPIEINGGEIAGTVMVGTLLNRNYTVVDQLKQEQGIPTATLFAKDWRISTNVSYIDGKTRAIGTRVAREVAETVLNRGETFLGKTNILGTDYLTSYGPLYDHQKQVNPSQAKPIGIVYVGEPQAETEYQKLLTNLRFTGYSIGGSMLLLASLVALPIASSFSRPLQRLSRFAQQVEAREQGVRLEATERQDEIGILSRQLNAMTA